MFKKTEAICTGFVRIVATPGTDTLRLTVQTPDRDTHFAMSPDECAQLAALLIRYAAAANRKAHDALADLEQARDDDR